MILSCGSPVCHQRHDTFKCAQRRIIHVYDDVSFMCTAAHPSSSELNSFISLRIRLICVWVEWHGWCHVDVMSCMHHRAVPHSLQWLKTETQREKQRAKGKETAIHVSRETNTMHCTRISVASCIIARNPLKDDLEQARRDSRKSPFSKPCAHCIHTRKAVALSMN